MEARVITRIEPTRRTHGLTPIRILRLGAAAEDLHDRFPDAPEKEKRWRTAAVSHREQPPGHRDKGTVGSRAGRVGASQQDAWQVQSQRPAGQQTGLRRLRRILRSQDLAQLRSLQDRHLAVQRQVQAGDRAQKRRREMLHRPCDGREGNGGVFQYRG